jgi:hypothetical protein
MRPLRSAVNARSASPALGRGSLLSAVRGGQQEVGITGQPFTGENIVDASGHTWERGGLAE